MTAPRPDPPPALSVVVPTRDRPEHLAAALAALQQTLRAGDELIVVDSASSDAVRIAAVVAGSGARLVRCVAPGASRARNAGWRAARHDCVAFVDDDVRVEAGWADAVSRALADHPDAAFVAGRVGAPPGSATMTVAVKDDARAHPIGAGDRGVLGHSANLAVRRVVLEEIGGFDEALGAGGRWRAAEDTDLIDRIIETGGSGWYEPAASAQHEQWRRIREWVLLQHDYGVGAGARLAKLWRRDRDRWAVVARDDVVTWGLAQLPAELGRRDFYRALGTVLRLLGMARGFLTALGHRLDEGHFRPASSSS